MTQVLSIGGVSINTGNYKSALLQSYTQPPRDVTSVPRHGGFSQVAAINYTSSYRLPPLGILIHDGVADVDAARRVLFAALDTATAVKALVIADDDGSNERYINVAVQAVDQVPDAHGEMFVATMIASGDQHWQSTTLTTETWSVTTSGETNEITVAGDLDVNPVYTVTPTDAKGDSVYRQFVMIGWRVNAAYASCPVRMTKNTATLVSGGQVVDEDSFSIFVDGREQNRWITDWDDANTRIWTNLNFAGGLTTSLAYINNDSSTTAMTSGSEVTTINCTTALTAWPDQGLIGIGNECFSYDGIDRVYNRFLNVGRAVYNTTAASHANKSRITWIQHVVEYVWGPAHARLTTFDEDVDEYGEAVLTDNSKPVFNLSLSDNSSWTFDDFARPGRYRPGPHWKSMGPDERAFYTRATYPSAIRTPVVESLGIHIDSPGQNSEAHYWQLHVPYGVDAITPLIYLFSKPTEYTIWRAWLEGLDQGQTVTWHEYDFPQYLHGDYIDEGYSELIQALVDMRDVNGNIVVNGGGIVRFGLSCKDLGELKVSTLTIDFDTTKLDIAYGQATETYLLVAKLENVTTGEYININMPMLIDETLTIDTANHTVTYSDGDKNQYQAITRSSFRRYWLRLAPGANELKWTETGMVGTDITVKYRARYY